MDSLASCPYPCAGDQGHQDVSPISDYGLQEILLVVLAAGFAYALRGVLVRFLRSVAKQTSSPFRDFAVRLLDEALVFSVVMLAAWYLLKTWDWQSVALGVKPIWVAGVGVIIARFVGSVLAIYGQRIGASESNERLAAAWPIVNRIVYFLIVLAGVLLALYVLDRSGDAVGNVVDDLHTDAADLWNQVRLRINNKLWEDSLAVVLAAWLGYMFRGVLVRILQLAAKRTAGLFDDFAVRLLDEALVLSVVMLAAVSLLDLWKLHSAALWAKSIWIAGGGVVIARFVGPALTIYEQRIGASDPNEALAAAWPIVNRIISFLIVLAGVLIALSLHDISLNHVLAGTGLVGAAIAFLARDMLTNFIAGVVLLADRPFEVGDRIGLGGTADAGTTWGEVVEIGVRTTTLRTPENALIVVPNGEAMRRDIVNYTRLGPGIEVRIPLSVAGEADLEQVESALEAVARRVSGVRPEPAPRALTLGLDAPSATVELRVWIDTIDVRAQVMGALTKASIKTIQAHGWLPSVGEGAERAERTERAGEGSAG